MRLFIYTSLLSVTLYARDSLSFDAIASHPLVWGLGGAALLFFIVWIVALSKTNKLHTLLKEKEEKIEWLRRIKGENEYRLTQQIQELEKHITELNHTVENLERQIKEGTKNQVVAKLEALQRKREQALKDAGVEA